MPMQYPQSLFVATVLLLLHTSAAMQFTVLDDCVSPYSKGHVSTSRPQVPGIAINITAAEFYESFAGIFRLSDGSSISSPARERIESLRYMQVRWFHGIKV